MKFEDLERQEKISLLILASLIRKDVSNLPYGKETAVKILIEVAKEIAEELN